VVNWASKVKGLLSKLGFYEVWLAQGVGNYKLFLSKLNQRIRDTYIQETNNSFNTSHRAQLYRHLFDNKFSYYLDVVKIKKYRIALSRLRVSSHRLAVESGRWRKPENVPFDQRVCASCNVLEDEYHFVLECNIYDELRLKYIKRYFWRYPSMFKFVMLLETNNYQMIRNLAIYTYKAFSKRQEFLNGQ